MHDGVGCGTEKEGIEPVCPKAGGLVLRLAQEKVGMADKWPITTAPIRKGIPHCPPHQHHHTEIHDILWWWVLVVGVHNLAHLCDPDTTIIAPSHLEQDVFHVDALHCATLQQGKASL